MTWRELNLSLEPIKQGVARMEEKLEEIDQGKWFGPRLDVVFTSGVVAALGIILAFFLH